MRAPAHDGLEAPPESLVDISDILERGGGEGAVPNAELNIYRVTNPVVDRFLMSNE